MSLPEDVLLEILLKVSYADLLNICTNNPLFYSMCMDDHYWQQRTIQDFGNILNINNIPWHNLYRMNKEKILIDDFNNLMTNHKNKVYDVSNFDLNNLTGIKVISRPIYRGNMKDPARQRFLMPEIQGYQQSKIIGAERLGRSNFIN